MNLQSATLNSIFQPDDLVCNISMWMSINGVLESSHSLNISRHLFVGLLTCAGELTTHKQRKHTVLKTLLINRLQLNIQRVILYNSDDS